MPQASGGSAGRSTIRDRPTLALSRFAGAVHRGGSRTLLPVVLLSQHAPRPMLQARLEEAVPYGEKAIEMDPQCAAAHKWCAGMTATG